MELRACAWLYNFMFFYSNESHGCLLRCVPACLVVVVVELMYNKWFNLWPLKPDRQQEPREPKDVESEIVKERSGAAVQREVLATSHFRNNWCHHQINFELAMTCSCNCCCCCSGVVLTLPTFTLMAAILHKKMEEQRYREIPWPPQIHQHRNQGVFVIVRSFLYE